MRNQQERNSTLFSYVSIEERITLRHPTADSEAGGSSPGSTQPHLLLALRQRRPAISPAQAIAADLVAVVFPQTPNLPWYGQHHQEAAARNSTHGRRRQDEDSADQYYYGAW